ncbi:MAG TPA: PAS domain-containing protein, partial [Actinomycetota bacterium]|nr:PAS domain-containing protein [Actinomycetota bacterium]
MSVVLAVALDAELTRALARTEPAWRLHPTDDPEGVDRLVRGERFDLVVVAPSVREPIRVAQRAHSADRTVPVVLLREPGDLEVVRRALQLTPLIGESVHCLPSPHDVGELAAVLREVLSESDARARHEATTSMLDQMLREATPTQRQHLGLILEHLPVGVISLDAELRIRGTNRAAAQLFAGPGADAIGSPVADGFDDPVGVETFLRGASSGTTPAELFAMRHPDGPRHLELIVAPAGAGSDGRGLLLLVQDVTARVLAERARDEAEEVLRFQKQLLEIESEATIDGILVVSPEGRILYSNRRFALMWGIPDDVMAAEGESAALEWVSHSVVDAVGFAARVRYLYEHPDEVDRDEILLRDGRVFDRFSTPLRDPQAGYLGRAWYFRDITQQKQLEANLRRSQERSELLANASAVFASSLDHEAILHRLAELAVAGAADWCAVDLTDADGRIRRLTATHRLPEKRALA